MSQTSGVWRLELHAGLPRTFRVAQLDDYGHEQRSRFRHAPPWTFSLRARLSNANLPGTWGFGLWNDPFGLSLGFGGQTARLPALPQTAWFMHASPPNWLSFRDDPSINSGQAIPGNGFFAGTFCSPNIPSYLLVPALLALPLCAIRPISRFLRKVTGRMIHQDARTVIVDITRWHEYSIVWLEKNCTFSVDGNELLSTSISPRPPLGLVIWIDNQYAAWNPQGLLAYGTLENPAAWLEIERMNIKQE